MESYIRTPVLSNSFGKIDKILGKASYLISPNLFNKFNNTWELMKDPLCQSIKIKLFLMSRLEFS